MDIEETVTKARVNEPKMHRKARVKEMKKKKKGSM